MDCIGTIPACRTLKVKTNHQQQMLDTISAVGFKQTQRRAGGEAIPIPFSDPFS